MLVASLTGGVILGTLAAGLVASVSPSLTVTSLVPLIPLGISLYAVYAQVPETPFRTPGRIDVPGFLGLAVVMVTLLSGLGLASAGGVGSSAALILLGLAVVLLVLWVLWERRTRSPAVDMALVASWKAAPIHLSGFLFGAVLLGGQSPLTTFLSADPAVTGYGFSASPGRISLVIAAIGLLATVGAAAFARIAHGIGPRRTLVLGATLAMAAHLFIAAFHLQMWQIWGYAVVAGFGMGVLLGGLPAFLAELTPTGQTGESVGVYNALRTLGGAAGGALFAVALGTATAQGDTFAGVWGYATMWVLCGVAFLVSAVVLLIPRIGPLGARDRSTATEQSEGTGTSA